MINCLCKKINFRMENFVGSSLTFPEHPHFYVLIEMFPDICRNYLRKLCLGKEETKETLEDLITELLNKNYKKIQRPLTKFEAKEAMKKHQTLIQLLPDADPVYLMDKVKNLSSDHIEFNKFVDELMVKRNYPLKSEYLKNIELQKEEQKYIKKIDIEYFLENIPYPEEHFEKEKISYNNNDDYFYALTYLKNKYHFLHVKEIIKTFDNAKNNVIEASKILETKKPTTDIEEPIHYINCKNISLLQEIAYVENKSDILDYIKLQNEQTLRAKNRAKEAGCFFTCECCYNEEVTLYDIVTCQSEHVFCSSCVKKFCEVIIGEGKVDFPCLTTCDSQFSLQVLQSVLPQKMFSKMAQRKQLEEVRQAEIDGLVFCPFCDFATILPPDDNIIQCQNEECMKDTCRLCKRISHVPFTCFEIKRQEIEELQRAEQQETKNRTYIEERMTEALLRTCYKCSKSFLKESGCNKITCSCGAMMCYVCKQSINGYNHFNQSGSRCPFYSDSNILHTEEVRQGAQKAKQDLGNVELKSDPSQNI